jgi:hypothetical protein
MDKQVERHESKQDVFEAVMCDYDEVFGCAVNHGYYGDALTAGEYRARYAATDKVPVPGEVARYLRWGKTFNIPLHVMFNFKFVRNQGFSPLNDGVEDWICDSPDDFAHAWLDGWYAEEDAK